MHVSVEVCIACFMCIDGVAIFPDFPTIQFLICLQYAKPEGSISHVNDIVVYLSRQRNELEAVACSICSNSEVLNVCKVKNLSLIVQNKKCIAKCIFQSKTLSSSNP